jgi:protein-L-isoaspartate(D-aspartate) O-methyltransferase
MLLDVIGQTPRHLFIDEALSHRAYEDTSLPIGFGQTISQPYTVARMTEILIAEEAPERVLEVGTGSGYQTAVLAQLIEKVYTVERIQALLDRARDTLKSVNMRNIQFKYDDGNMGWAERGPFDAIIVTASARHVPQELVDQLAEGGRLLIPVGTADSQKLMLIRSDGEATEIEDVRFVPLLGGKS